MSSTRQNKNILITLCAASVLLLSGSYAHAQFNEGRMKDRMEKRFKEVIEQLNLSENQKSLLEENKKNRAVVVEALKTNVRLTMKSIGEELKKKNLDMSQIASLRVQLRNFRNQMEDDRFAAILEVRKILTQEQFAQFVELIEKHKEKKNDD